MKTPQLAPMAGMAPLGVKPNPETELRALWTAQGVPADRQNAMIAEIEAKARPGAYVGPFQIGNPRNVDEKTVAERKWRAPLKPKAEQKACDAGLFSDDSKQSELF